MEKIQTTSMEKVQTLMEDSRKTSHGANSFQDHQESTDVVKKTFATIFRSKSVASICNNREPEGKTKILMILQIKLSHQNGIDDVKVKVDDGCRG